MLTGDVASRAGGDEVGDDGSAAHCSATGGRGNESDDEKVRHEERGAGSVVLVGA